jgi:hypothetical protein
MEEGLRQMKEAGEAQGAKVAELETGEMVVTVGEVSEGGCDYAKGGQGGKIRWVVLTDSNGRDIGPDNIKAHIPKYQR